MIFAVTATPAKHAVIIKWQNKLYRRFPLITFASSLLSAMGIRHLLIPQLLHVRAKMSLSTKKRHKKGNICQSEWEIAIRLLAPPDDDDKLEWKYVSFSTSCWNRANMLLYNDDDGALKIISFHSSLPQNIINWRLFFIGFSLTLFRLNNFFSSSLLA